MRIGTMWYNEVYADKLAGRPPRSAQAVVNVWYGVKMAQTDATQTKSKGKHKECQRRLRNANVSMEVNKHRMKGAHAYS